MATSDVQIVNFALTLLGESRILSLDDNLKQAREAKAIYAMDRDALLAAHGWTFANARAILPALAAVPLFEYSTAFALPDDCLRVNFIGDRYVGLDLTDYRGSPVEEYAIEGRSILARDPVVSASADASVSGGDIAALTVTETGYGYVQNPTFTFTGGGGSGLVAQSVLTALGWDSNTLGSGYALDSTLTAVGGVLKPGGQPLTLQMVAGGGLVDPQSAVITYPGDYISVPGTPSGQMTVVTLSGGGSGADILVWWGLGTPYITNPGSGYTSAPVVALVHPGTPPTDDGIIVATVNPQSVSGGSSSFLNIKYTARVTDPTKFHPNYTRALGCLLAADLAETLTQSGSKREAAMVNFKNEIRDAIRANAIQIPPQKLPDDEWVMSRR